MDEMSLALLQEIRNQMVDMKNMLFTIAKAQAKLAEIEPPTIQYPGSYPR